MADTGTTDRAIQMTLIAATVGFSWLAMQATHEAGHVMHAWLSGGTVACVVLHPAIISHTVVWPNPRPLFVVWGGPIWGCLIPLALWGATRRFARRFAFLARFFAGFCLIVNGVYLGASAAMGGRELDGPVILACGGSAWHVALFSLVATGAGIWAWHGLGSDFGFGPAEGRVDRRATAVVAVLFAMLVVIEIACVTP
ncbi:MAG: hypothetical protein GX621_06485 [Pirellulaceae bacterium]|nr:hypothetical protein [Pirellulaceae bacterium]